MSKNEFRSGFVCFVGRPNTGKSTLTKVMAGVVPLSSGQMLVHGQEVQLSTPLQALEHGIAMVFQETSLVPTMTVAQNLFLGQEQFFNRLRGVYISAQQFLQSLNFDVDPTATVSLLGAAKKQMVEIARAVLHQASVIIFDEPTASLDSHTADQVLDLMRERGHAEGAAFVIATHDSRLTQRCDRIVALLDGRLV